MSSTDKKAPKWSVSLSKSADKMAKKMPKLILDLLATLIEDIEELGPVQKDWHHFSKLESGPRIPDYAYHCHLKRIKTTYVACWKVNKESKKVEIFYVGTHENAPYKA